MNELLESLVRKEAKGFNRMFPGVEELVVESVKNPSKLTAHFLNGGIFTHLYPQIVNYMEMELRVSKASQEAVNYLNHFTNMSKEEWVNIAGTDFQAAIKAAKNYADTVSGTTELETGLEIRWNNKEGVEGFDYIEGVAPKKKGSPYPNDYRKRTIKMQDHLFTGERRLQAMVDEAINKLSFFKRLRTSNVVLNIPVTRTIHTDAINVKAEYENKKGHYVESRQYISEQRSGSLSMFRPTDLWREFYKEELEEVEQTRTELYKEIAPVAAAYFAARAIRKVPETVEKEKRILTSDKDIIRVRHNRKNSEIEEEQKRIEEFNEEGKRIYQLHITR